MIQRKILYTFAGLLLALNVILFSTEREGDFAKVIFFDVGQGDAILISSGDNQILVDGGSDGMKLLEKVGSQVPFWDRTIEMVVLSHPDMDHAGGLIELFRKYQVDYFFSNGDGSEAQFFEILQKEIDNGKTQRLESGGEFSGEIEGVLKMRLRSPGKNENSKDKNENSLAMLLELGNSKFLLAGDLPLGEEEKLADFWKEKINFLKVSHHGSKSSTSEKFLEQIDPEAAVISVGKGNRYGHPSLEVLESLTRKNIRILRTDEEGDVAFHCEKNECLIN